MRAVRSSSLLLLLFLSLVVVVPRSRADIARESPLLHQKLKSSVMLNQFPGDPDTVWVGHITGTYVVPWSANPLWTGYGPFHVGRADNRVKNWPTSPLTIGNNGYWDFDRFNPGENDTLQGWTAIRQPYQSIDTFVGTDRATRWFMCFDYGNSGNHRETSGKQSYGVLGYWHVDGGNTTPSIAIPNTTPTTPAWAPIAGAGSAWCGLRAHGDIAVREPETGVATYKKQWFNASIIQNRGDNTFRQFDAQNPQGSDANFPGYGGQWDQMLYHDYVLTDGSSLSLDFDYRTSMSDQKATDANGNAYGYFYYDPLLIPYPNDGNFISASDAGPDAPRDSFMVYVGVPVNDAAWVGANGGTPQPVYDRQRRWFSEVLNMNVPMLHVLGVSGVHGTTHHGVVIPNATIQPMLNATAGAGGTIRVVFRVKTDRGLDDEDTFQRNFSSQTAGAALIDNVAVNGFGVSGFNTASEIDDAISIAPTATWKSTGKPIGSQWHYHNLEGGAPYTNLIYSDPLGTIGSPTRQCNMRNVVISAGSHDYSDKLSGGYGSWEQEIQDWFMSPTINLCSTGIGSGFYNEMGIDSEIASRAHDIRVQFDIYQYGFSLKNTGSVIRCGWATYPVQQANGVKCWGVRKPAVVSDYTGNVGCFATSGLWGASGRYGDRIFTSNISNTPDSLRVLIEHLSVCFRNTSAVDACGPDQTDPNGGAYIDNLSIMFINNGAATPCCATQALAAIGSYPGNVAMTPWDALQDAFPDGGAGIDALIGTALFDTVAAKVKTGRNISPPTGSTSRPVVGADAMVVEAPGTGVRMDLVFRILPGPGNYMTIGDRSSGLRKRPDGAAAGLANKVAPNDGSWWGTLMANIGTFGTYVDQTHANSPAAGSTAPTYTMREVHVQRGDPGWLADRWDPDIWISVRMDTLQKLGVDPSVQGGHYMTTIHESELGLTTGPNEAVDPDAGRLIAFVGPGEYVKILPDGQFTAGTHVEYFFRASKLLDYVQYGLMPDTTAIYPQPAFTGMNWEAIRFASWDVLPDRWKDPAWPGNAGTPIACMLVANYAYRRGDGAMWNDMSRAIGLTRTAKWGAGHGYWASPTTAFPGFATDPGTTALSANRGQEGSLYDVYDVTGGESNVVAGRLGNRLALGGCPAPTGPTAKMLRTYYRTLFVLSADIGETSWGPFPDQSDDDAGLFTDFITNPSPAPSRFVGVIGRKAASGLDSHANTATLLANHFGTLVRSADYRADAVSVEDAPDLIVSPPLVANSTPYGVFSPAYFRTDALDINGAVSYPVSAVADFENTGVGDPWHAAIYTSAATGHVANTLVAAWTLGALGGPDMNRGQEGSRFTINRGGTHLLWLSLMTNMVQGCASLGNPIGVGDLPGNDGTPYAQFFDVRSANPVRSGTAIVAFGVTRKEQVEVVIYDVSGRRVRTLANRVFEPKAEGHTLEWDGRDDEGRGVRAGVYFYQLRTPSFTGERKITMLRN